MTPNLPWTIPLGSHMLSLSTLAQTISPLSLIHPRKCSRLVCHQWIILPLSLEKLTLKTINVCFYAGVRNFLESIKTRYAAMGDRLQIFYACGPKPLLQDPACQYVKNACANVTNVHYIDVQNVLDLSTDLGCNAHPNVRVAPSLLLSALSRYTLHTTTSHHTPTHTSLSSLCDCFLYVCLFVFRWLDIKRWLQLCFPWFKLSWVGSPRSRAPLPRPGCCLLSDTP